MFRLNLLNVQINATKADHLFVPYPMNFFLWQRPRSRFLHCNSTNAARLRQKISYRRHLRRGPKIQPEYVQEMAHLRDVLVSLGVTPMLCCGTALGMQL